MFLETLDRLLARLQRRDIDRETDEEIRFHIEQSIEKHVAAGLSPEEARRVTLRDFGGVAQTKEACREARLTWLDAAWQDVRYALRSFRRDPAFTVTVLLTLAVGIGATTSAFSIVDGVLFRPLPYDHPDRVMMLMARSAKTGALAEGLGQEEFTALHRSKSFAAVASYSSFVVGSLLTTGNGPAERVRTAEATSEFLRVLGVRPLLGRDFGPDDGRAGRVGLLTHTSWQHRFGGDPSIVNRTLTFQDGTVTIVGVLPRDFWYPRTTARNAPEMLLADPVSWDKPLPARRVRFLVGRLRDGMSVQSAQAEADVISSGLKAVPGKPSSDYGIHVRPLRDQMVFFVKQGLLLVLGAVLFLLLIACFNVSNLLAARGRAREREFAVRNSLGAGRHRLVRQMFTESLVLAVAGGAAGITLSYWTFDLLLSQVPERFLLTPDIGIDGRVLAFSSILTLATVLLFGIVPAIRISRPDIATSLKPRPGWSCSSGTSSRGVLLAAEVALALVLLTGAGLLVNSFVRLMDIDVGFDHRNLVAGSAVAPPSRYPTDRDVTRFFDRAIEGLRTVPGVKEVAAADVPPLNSALMGAPVLMEGLPDEQIAETLRVSSSYFATLGIRLVKGRVFGPADERGQASVAVVNEALARRFWGGKDPVGQRVVVWQNTPVQIVGVVADTRSTLRGRDGRRSVASPTVYVPYDASYPGFRGRNLIVRTLPGYGNLAPVLSRQMASIDPEVPVTMRAVEESYEAAFATPRFHLLVFGLFASIGLLLAGVGIAGVAAHNVTRRTHEIGVRLALGSSPDRVVRLLAGQAMLPVAVGLLAGLFASAALTRLLASLLFEVAPRDPSTFVAVSVLLAAVALLASYIPARRAAAVDTVRVLGAE